MTRNCDLCVGRTESGYVIRVQGSGTSAHSPALAEFVSVCFRQRPKTRIAIDLIGCNYLDSTFLGCLLKLQRLGTDQRLEVVADEATRKRLLAATRLDDHLNVVGAAPASASGFVKIDAKPLSDRELGQHIMESHEALAEIPSHVAETFRKIAMRLKTELQQRDQDERSLQDTVVISNPPTD